MTMTSTLVIRPEIPADLPGIRTLNRAAFARDAEADLVDNLRAVGAIKLSLVAKSSGMVLGHVLFSPMLIVDGVQSHAAVGLGPMAVLPSYQRRGIGSQLVRSGIVQLKEMGHEILFVLGHPWFYPKFGFEPAASYGITWENKPAIDAFMVLALKAGALKGVKGSARYHPAFDGV